jgi:hypothetical protein
VGLVVEARPAGELWALRVFVAKCWGVNKQWFDAVHRNEVSNSNRANMLSDGDFMDDDEIAQYLGQVSLEQEQNFEGLDDNSSSSEGVMGPGEASPPSSDSGFEWLTFKRYWTDMIPYCGDSSSSEAIEVNGHDNALYDDLLDADVARCMIPLPSR